MGSVVLEYVEAMIDGAHETAPRWPLTVLRIYAGLVFISAAALGATPSRPLLISALESIAGAALLLGFATPAAAVLGLGIVAATMLPLHGLSVLVSPGPRTAFAVLLVTVALARAGRLLGLDAVLTKRFPRSPLW